jgi:hypothetical protein
LRRRYENASNVEHRGDLLQSDDRLDIVCEKGYTWLWADFVTCLKVCFYQFFVIFSALQLYSISARAQIQVCFYQFFVIFSALQLYFISVRAQIQADNISVETTVECMGYLFLVLLTYLDSSTAYLGVVHI